MIKNNFNYIKSKVEFIELFLRMYSWAVLYILYCFDKLTDSPGEPYKFPNRDFTSTKVL